MEANRSGDTVTGYNPLDLLAVASDNVTLKQQVSKLILQNEQLMRETSSRSSQKQEWSSDHILSFHALKVTKHKDECVYYTGFSKEQFTSILNFLVPDNNIFNQEKT